MRERSREGLRESRETERACAGETKRKSGRARVRERLREGVERGERESTHALPVGVIKRKTGEKGG